MTIGRMSYELKKKVDDNKRLAFSEVHKLLLRRPEFKYLYDDLVGEALEQLVVSTAAYVEAYKHSSGKKASYGYSSWVVTGVKQRLSDYLRVEQRYNDRSYKPIRELKDKKEFSIDVFPGSVVNLKQLIGLLSDDSQDFIEGVNSYGQKLYKDKILKASGSTFYKRKERTIKEIRDR